MKRDVKERERRAIKDVASGAEDRDRNREREPLSLLVPASASAAAFCRYISLAAAQESLA